MKQTDLSMINIDSFYRGDGPSPLSQSILDLPHAGIFGRVNYDYEGRYIFEVKRLRRRFARVSNPHHRWDFFSPRYRPHGVSSGAGVVLRTRARR